LGSKAQGAPPPPPDLFGDIASGQPSSLVAPTGVAKAVGIDFSTYAFAKGGLVHYYDKGLLIPKGTDTIPAMLTPNEYVMNAASTNKFLPQLESMNKGINPYTFPEYHAEGGMIASFTPQVLTPNTNYYNTGGSVKTLSTNVGDIHVNITHNAKNAIDGKMIAEQLRREIRKGTIDDSFFKKG
jgi:hypothetical protein